MHKYTAILTKHNGKENKNFKLVRSSGTSDYLFLHFKTPVIFTLKGKTHKLEPETCILLTPETPHSFYPDGCELIHDWIHFLPPKDGSFEKLKIDLNTFFISENLGFITTSLKKCELELINKDDFSEEFISAELTSMFIKLKRQLSGYIFGCHADSFKSLRTDIYRNPDKYPNTECMAYYTALSRSRFSVLYKSFFNVSPKNDLINARISKAIYLLSIETLSLSEISEKCGYTNIYHFIRQFRTVTGNTPGNYRKHL